MVKKRRAAREVAQDRGGGEYWIDHAVVDEDDADWLRDARWLTLWNVTLPPRFLASIPQLEGVDLRGGSADDLSALEGCHGLRCLVVNQVRGLVDISMIEQTRNLVVLSLYGLPNVVKAPSLLRHTALLRLELGLMRGLPGLGGFLDAPALRELFLVKRMTVTPADVARIKQSRIASFEWWGEDTPVSMWSPVVEEVGLPRAPRAFPRESLTRLG
jgi:hypothetical protein